MANKHHAPLGTQDSATCQTAADSALIVDESVSIGCPTAQPRTGPQCEECGAPLKSDMVTVCHCCGWYPSLGRYVEVEPGWDAEHSDDVGKVAPTGTAPASHLEVWLRLLPPWAWIIIASMAAVVVESVVVRLATPAEIGGLRTTWSLTQLAVGALVFFGCHGFNYLLLVADDASVGVLDFVLRPLKLWLRTAQQLPARLWLVNSAVCGLTATIMAIAVIGALPYDRFWDWGFKAPPKQNLMGAVMDRAKKLEGRGADNLEDAVADFAGKAGVDEPASLPAATPDKPRSKADCLILGYELDGDDHLHELVLATAHNGKLVYAGRVKPQLSDQERDELLKELSRSQSRQPFIHVEGVSTYWVQAKYACRVSYREKSPGGRLLDIQWDSLLGTIRTP